MKVKESMCDEVRVLVLQDALFQFCMEANKMEAEIAALRSDIASAFNAGVEAAAEVCDNLWDCTGDDCAAAIRALEKGGENEVADAG